MLVAPSLGFESIDAERSVSVETAGNPNAQLGLDSSYNGSQIVYQPGGFFTPEEVENQVVANVTNNIDNSITASVSVSSVQWSDGSGPALEVINQDDFSDSMANGTTRQVVLGCSQTVGGFANDATVELSVDAQGDPVSVAGATLQIDGVSFDCAGGAGGDPPTEPVPIDQTNLELATQPSASEAPFFGDYSIVSFDLQNTGTQSVTISGIHVSDSSIGTRIQRGTEVQIDASSSGSLNSETGLTIGPDEPTFQFDQNATLTGGETATVTIAQFRDGDSWFDQVDMRGESVTVVFIVDGLEIQGRDDPVPVEMELQVQ